MSLIFDVMRHPSGIPSDSDHATAESTELLHQQLPDGVHHRAIFGTVLKEARKRVGVLHVRTACFLVEDFGQHARLEHSPAIALDCIFNLGIICNALPKRIDNHPVAVGEVARPLFVELIDQRLQRVALLVENGIAAALRRLELVPFKIGSFRQNNTSPCSYRPRHFAPHPYLKKTAAAGKTHSGRKIRRTERKGSLAQVI